MNRSLGLMALSFTTVLIFGACQYDAADEIGYDPDSGRLCYGDLNDDGQLDYADQATPFTKTGRIVFNDIEGGFFGIMADDGFKLQPLNLADEFKQEGMRVRFEGMTRPNTMSIANWGIPVDIKKISRI